MSDSTPEQIPVEQRGKITHRSMRYGASVLGAPLEVFLPDRESPALLVMAAHHGDEPETTALLSAVLRSIASHQLHCAVILAANPDGLARGTRGNAQGVDLNRNFPTQDWREGPILHCWYDKEPKRVQLDTGNTPASEPETQALLSLVESLAPQAILSIHSRLGCVDDPNTTPLGQWLSQHTQLPLVPDIGYPTPGSFGTWALENNVPLITLELPDASIVMIRKTIAPILETLLTQPRDILRG